MYFLFAEFSNFLHRAKKQKKAEKVLKDPANYLDCL
jgi:hypothetical protein